MKSNKKNDSSPVYGSASQLWRKHITLFDEEVKKGKNPHGIFVDGGCGHEQFVERYSDYFRFCIGIDLDIERRDKSKENTHYLKANLEHIPLKSACTDVFLTNFVFEHLREPSKVFKEISRVMKIGGVFISWTPNVNSPSGMIIRMLPFSMVKALKKTFYGGDSPCPTYYLANTPSRLDAMLRSVDFKRIRIEMIDGVFYISKSRFVRWFHTMFIKLTNHGNLCWLKDIIFTVYLKSE